MATQSGILAWRIPWTEEPGGLKSMRSQRVRHDWAQALMSHVAHNKCLYHFVQFSSVAQSMSVLYRAHLCMKCSLGISNFLEEICSLSHSVVFCCIDCWRRLSYLFLLFFGTLHSDAYIFPLLLCFSLLFFSQLFVRPSQTAILLFCISFPWGWSWSLSPVQCHVGEGNGNPLQYSCLENPMGGGAW